VRWSTSFIPTLRDDPADAEAVSHKLLVRAGFIRQLVSGVYTLLPLGQRVSNKIASIMREEMNKIGAQECQLPAMHPGELWQRSGRWQSVGEELFRLQDRRGADFALAISNEEIFAAVASELRSYKQLPQIWYQLQIKFRDEPRPKSGLLRVREFFMKDSYSFDVDEAGLALSFDRHMEAYRRIFRRFGLETLAVEASSGSMGGSESVEFMVKSDAGEDWVVSCSACGYAANVEKATSTIPSVEDAPGSEAPEKFPTPGVRTIDDLAKFEGGAPGDRQIKTLVYLIDGKTVLLLMRGDHALVEQKLIDQVEGGEIRPAEDGEIRAALGAGGGSLGAVGVMDHYIIADESLRGRSNMVTGANEDDFHLRGVDIERDVSVNAWLDLREVEDGDACPMCAKSLAVFKTIEVGHVFKLGTTYSEAFEAKVLDQNGVSRPVVMGSYGIGLGRSLAAVVESHHDDAGIIWPVNLAPFEAVVSVLNPKDVRTRETGERIYEALREAGIDVIIDDRDERPGVKFKDAELVGIPYRVTIGPKGLQDGQVEFKRRRDGESRDLPVDHAAESMIEDILQERR
jgi:prolyl-tRNA synthetase